MAASKISNQKNVMNILNLTFVLFLFILTANIFSQQHVVCDSIENNVTNENTLRFSGIQVANYIASITGFVSSLVFIKNKQSKYIGAYGSITNFISFPIYSNIKLKRKTTVITLFGTYAGGIIGSYLSYQIINHWDGVRRTARRGGSNALIYPVAILGIAGLPGIGASAGGFLTSKEKEKIISKNNFTMHPYYAFSKDRLEFGFQIYH